MVPLPVMVTLAPFVMDRIALALSLQMSSVFLMVLPFRSSVMSLLMASWVFCSTSASKIMVLPFAARRIASASVSYFLLPTWAI